MYLKSTVFCILNRLYFVSIILVIGPGTVCCFSSSYYIFIQFRLSKFHLSHLLSVDFWVLGNFCQQNRVFTRINMKNVLEQVMPDLLHVVPVCDHTTFDRVFQSENPSMDLSFFAHVTVITGHSNIALKKKIDICILFSSLNSIQQIIFFIVE